MTVAEMTGTPRRELSQRARSHGATPSLARTWEEAGGKEITGTLAEQLPAEGMAKGKAEGKAETFLLIARQKFRDIPSARQEQLLAASPRQLDEWALRLLLAPDLDSVFNGDLGDRNDVGGERFDFEH